MISSRFWILHGDYETRQALLGAQRQQQFAMLSDEAMGEALRAFNRRLPGDSPWPNPLPQDFPRPLLRMPIDNNPLFAPDYFAWGSWLFVSRRLREAMALPEWAASYVPAKVEAGSDCAHAQDYALLYLLAFGHAIDCEASQCKVTTYKSAKTGNTVTDIDALTQVRFKETFVSPCNLFFDQARGRSVLFATDTLAQRVLDAGCTGIEFLHPLWFKEALGNHVLRTAGGMARVLWNDIGSEYEIVPISADEADAGPITPVLHEFEQVMPPRGPRLPPR